jgi:hypothetical protein
MNKRDLQLQDILSKDLPSDEEIKVYALEGFAKEIDYHNQTTPPYDQISKIWANLSSVFSAWVEAGQDPSALSAKDVQIKTDASGAVSLYVKDTFIVEVDEYHASLNKATKAQLAEKWAANLKRGVEAFVAINELL